MNSNLSNLPARSKCWIYHVHSVRRGKHDNAIQSLDSIELGEQLADDPFGHHAVSSQTSDWCERVDLIEEYYTWRSLSSSPEILP